MRLFDTGQSVPLVRRRRLDLTIEVNEEAQERVVAEEIELGNKLASKDRM